MTEEKPRKPKGVPIPLGNWWHTLILEAFKGLSDVVVAERITNAADPGWHWDRKEIERLRKGKAQPTLELLRAISKAFSVVNPVYVASSKEEAYAMLAVKNEHERKRAEAMASFRGVGAKAIEQHFVREMGVEDVADMSVTAETDAKKRAVKNADKREKEQAKRDRHKNHD